MRPFSYVVGIDEKLAQKKEVVDAGTPETKKEATTSTRINKKDLEDIYIADGIVFNSVNKIVQTIMAAGWTYEFPNPKNEKFFTEFLETVGRVGGGHTWYELVQNMYKYQCIYGESWNELVFSNKGDKIVDLDEIDPKTMDYQKTGSGEIELDEYNNPVGYTQTIRGIKTDIPLEKIAHFSLYEVGEGWYGIGIVEPIYKTTMRKINQEDAITNTSWRMGHPTYVAKLGDENHEPTPKQIDNVLEKLKDLTFKSQIAIPYYYDIDILQPKNPEKLQQQLDYYVDAQVAAMGIPKPYATGGGEDTNRATLNRQSRLFELTLKDIINQTSRQIERQIFKPIAETNGIKGIPKIIWGDVGVEELNDKANRLASYIDKGIITASPELRDYIKIIEELPEGKDTPDADTETER